MLTIAICDPDYGSRCEIKDKLLKLLFEEVEVQFVEYKDGRKLLDDVTNYNFKAQLMFIEVLLPGVNGMQVVSAMRKWEYDTDIIFLTEILEMALEGYRYHVFDYLLKPVSLKKFGDTVQRYVAEKLRPQSARLSVNIRGSIQKLPLQRILYFESRERKIGAIMGDREVEFYQKMNDLTEQLRGTNFVRCHQSYLVNLDFVSVVTASAMVLEDGRRIPVSKRYSKELKDYILGLNQEEQ